MLRTVLLTTVAILALSAAPVRAEEAANENGFKTAFSQAVDAIKGWFGPEKPIAAEPASAPQTAMDDNIQVPPPVDAPEGIEPAAGFDENVLQVPPPYYGPQSNNTDAKPRASSFDNNPSMAAFNDGPSAADLNAISSAAGDETPADTSKMDCDAVKKAAEEAQEGDDVPDTALIEACEAPQDSGATPAQPAFEISPDAQQPAPNALPTTQPAAGEPPIGGAVMPGEPAAQ